MDKYYDVKIASIIDWALDKADITLTPFITCGRMSTSKTIPNE